MRIAEQYEIKQERGNDMFKCSIEWTDIKGGCHKHEYSDPNEAETLIGLLTGNVRLSDLEP